MKTSIYDILIGRFRYVSWIGYGELLLHLNLALCTARQFRRLAMRYVVVVVSNIAFWFRDWHCGF